MSLEQQALNTSTTVINETLNQTLDSATTIAGNLTCVGIACITDVASNAFWGAVGFCRNHALAIGVTAAAVIAVPTLLYCFSAPSSKPEDKTKENGNGQKEIPSLEALVPKTKSLDEGKKTRRSKKGRRTSAKKQ